MNDSDKTDKVVPLTELEQELHAPGTPIVEDEHLTKEGVFRRFALWVLGKKG